MHDTVVRTGARVARAIIDSHVDVAVGVEVHSIDHHQPAIYGRTRPT